MADRTVKVTLTAQAQGYIAAMEQAAKATRDAGSEAEKLAQQSQAFQTMGQAAMVAGGMVLGGLTLATKAAIDWDSSWAGVLKTVEGSDAELAKVESGLRGLTAVLPASHAEIAAVAEAAGQLGIKTPEVVEFTRTMIDLGETTNLSSEQAATSLARFMTVMGTAQSDVSGLGSSLVELGNNYATTEAEIMAMAMRLAGAGNQIGMSEGQVLGLSTALSSVGIEAEAGGSAMSKVMIDIASSVEKGGERLEKFAAVAGVSADQFAAKWRSDPGEALAAFVRGLANAEAQGKSTFGILEELGITEVRMRDALLRSASAADQFSEAMATGSEAMGENSALADEASKRYETTAAQLGIMRNRVVDAAIGFGEHLLPVLEYGAESVGNLAEGFASMDGPMQAFVAWGAAIVGTGLLGAGVWMVAVPKIAEYRNAMDQLNLTGGRLHRTLGFVGKAATLAALGSAIVALSREAEPELAGLANALDRAASSAELMGAAAEAQASKAGAFKNVLPEITLGVTEVADALDYAAKKSDQGLFRIDPANKVTLNEYIETLGILGDEMAKVGEADLPRMQSALMAMSDEYKMTERQQWAFIEGSDSLRSVLEGAAGDLNLTTERADLLAIAFGGVAPAAEGAADGADTQKASLEELAGVAAKTSDEIADLADQIRNFGEGAFDMEGSAIKLQAEYQKLAESFAEGGQSLDITTEAGRDTVSMLLDIASAANASAGATFEMTGSQEQANAILDEARQKIVDARVALDESPEAAAAWADQFLSSSQAVSEAAEASKVAIEDIPDEKKIFMDADTAAALEGIDGVQVIQIDEKTAVVVGDTDDAMTKITEVALNNPPDKVLEISADAADAYAGIEGVNVRKVNGKTAYVWGNNAEAIKRIEEVNGTQTPRKMVWIGADDSGFRGVWDSIMNLGPTQKVVNFVTGSKPDPNANGGIYAYANGGIAAYAGGGFATGIYKGGAPIHKFAEPETVWEAYISGKPDQRERNRQIWVETGERLGMSAAGGGVAPVVYVQNPFTGKYLLGKVDQIANAAIDGYAEEQAQAGRRAGY